MLVSPDAALRWLKPGSDAFEPALLEAVTLLVRPGDVVWDMGANVGLFGLTAAIRSGTTALCVDADPFLTGLIRRTASLARNRAIDLRVLCCAVGDRDGVYEFAVAGRGRASSGLAVGTLSSQHGATRELMRVPGFRTDTLLAAFPAPALVKVDLEGAEAMFVAGAPRLLGEIQPLLYIEVTEPLRARVYPALTGSGYRLAEIVGGRVRALGNGQASDNIVAIPRDRHGEFALND